MSDGPSIQHKAAHTGEPGFAFEAGQRVPSVEPETYFDDPPTAAPRCALDSDQLLGLLITGAWDKDEIAARVLILAMLRKHPAAPQTMTALTLWLDIPRTTADRKRERVLQDLQELLNDFGK